MDPPALNDDTGLLKPARLARAACLQRTADGYLDAEALCSSAGCGFIREDYETSYADLIKQPFITENGFVWAAPSLAIEMGRDAGIGDVVQGWVNDWATRTSSEAPDTGVTGHDAHWDAAPHGEPRQPLSSALLRPEDSITRYGDRFAAQELPLKVEKFNFKAVEVIGEIHIGSTVTSEKLDAMLAPPAETPDPLAPYKSDKFKVPFAKLKSDGQIARVATYGTGESKGEITIRQGDLPGAKLEAMYARVGAVTIPEKCAALDQILARRRAWDGVSLIDKLDALEAEYIAKFCPETPAEVRGTTQPPVMSAEAYCKLSSEAIAREDARVLTTTEAHDPFKLAFEIVNAPDPVQIERDLVRAHLASRGIVIAAPEAMVKRAAVDDGGEAPDPAQGYGERATERLAASVGFKIVHKQPGALQLARQEIADKLAAVMLTTGGADEIAAKSRQYVVRDAIAAALQVPSQELADTPTPACALVESLKAQAAHAAACESLEREFESESLPRSPVRTLVVPDSPKTEPRGKEFDLMVDDVGPKPEVTDLAALFLPVTAGEEEPWVDARRLHEALGVGKRFTSWIAGRVEAPGFVEGTDYIESEGLSLPTPGSSKSRPQKTKEYTLTLDMAKHLALLERNEQGGKVRRYFVACEKELQRRQLAERVPAIELKQAKDGGTFIAGLLTEAAVKNVAAEAALKEATDRATKAEQALGDAVIQPGLAATVSAMGINLETEKHRADYWAKEAKALQEKLVASQSWLYCAKTWEAEVLALREKLTTMVPRLIPTDTMSMTGFVDAYPELGLGRNQLTTFLRARGVLYTGPHKNGGVHTDSPIVKTYIDNGYFAYDKSLIQRQRKSGNVDEVIYLNAHVTPKGIPWLLKEIETHELLLIHRALLERAKSVDPEDVATYKVLKRLKGKWVAELGSKTYDRLRSALTSDDAAASMQSTGSASVHEHGRL